ncbi:hypothetical protein RvY_05121 [Ramazzottius varieornatus]|uniref:Uncharacterized protein n=1 Tax=Ramazzottius varieornatus TaxID=947166 RepID=A0A1D1UXI8_RAMVA|nr:hypothetical protein RvY_05121 [Ramazzottius varieornatus]
MVNITVFNPWTGKKPTTVKEVDALESGSHDAEAQLLSSSTVDSRWNKRGKSFCYFTVADICAFLALILVLLCAGYMLHRLWVVKSEVDEMYPTVSRLSADIQRLREDADALQAEKGALLETSLAQGAVDVNDYVDDNGEKGLNLAMEDTEEDVLRNLQKSYQPTTDNAFREDKEMSAAETELDKVLTQVAKHFDVSISDTKANASERDEHTVAFLNALTVQPVLDDDDEEDDDIEEADILPQDSEVAEQEAGFNKKTTDDVDSGNSSEDDA